MNNRYCLLHLVSVLPQLHGEIPSDAPALADQSFYRWLLLGGPGLHGL
jgi:hypothetical protein